MEENNQENNIPSKAKINPLGISSLVLGLVGILIAGIPCGIAAIIVKYSKDKENVSVVTVVLAVIGLLIGIADVTLVAIALPKIIENVTNNTQNLVK